MFFALIVIAALFHSSLTAPLTKEQIEEGFVRSGDLLEFKYEKRNFMSNERKLWPNAEVPYYIQPDLEHQREKIMAAFNHISNNTCIRFRPKREDETEYISLYNGGACFAYVGRTGRHVPVSLGPGCEELIPAAHEIMHSLGVAHTQSRSDRDEYLIVHYENMIPGVELNYQKLSPQQNRLYVPFDFDSIMLYGPYMASVNGGQVLEARDPKQEFLDTYDKTEMSYSDIKGLNMLYKCERFGKQYAYEQIYKVVEIDD